MPRKSPTSELNHFNFKSIFYLISCGEKNDALYIWWRATLIP